jgi:hypothetical protein
MMEPDKSNALVELLDRALSKGIVVQADVIISVAEIPLIGINLRAMIAGMSTMIEYGLMEEWDASIRNNFVPRKVVSAMSNKNEVHV